MSSVPDRARFDVNRRCAKCDLRFSAGVTYRSLQSWGAPIYDPHLVVTCPQCGYAWEMDCADA